MPAKKPLPKPNPILMKIADIHIRKQDLPNTPLPPQSQAFEDLKKLFKRRGILIPVFVDADGILLSGHYRLWAWQEMGHKHIPTVVVDGEEGIPSYFV